MSWKDRQKQQLRESLVSTALEILEEKGLVDTSVDDIVQRIGIAKGTFYLYFKSKADIVRAALGTGLEMLENGVLSVRNNPPDDPRQEIRGVIQAQLAFFEEHHSIINLLLSGGLASSQLPSEIWDELRARYRSATTLIYEDIIRKAQQKKLYREMDPYTAAYVLYGIITGLIYEAQGSKRQFTDIGKVAIEFFEEGVQQIA